MFFNVYYILIGQFIYLSDADQYQSILYEIAPRWPIASWSVTPRYVKYTQSDIIHVYIDL